MKNKNCQITVLQKIIFSLGKFPTSVLIVAIGSFVVYYYTEYVGISMASVTLMLFITRIWDAVNDPIFGIIADKVPEMKFGKNKVFLIIAGIWGAIAYYLMFSIPVNSSEIVQLVWMYVSYIGVGMALTIFQISTFGLFVKLASTEKERTNLAGLQVLFGALGAMLPTILLIPMVRVLGQGNDLKGYSKLAGLVALLFIICIGLITFIVPERKQEKKNIKEKVSILTSIKVVLANKPALLVSIAGFFTSAGAIINTLLTPYFAKYVIGDEMFISFAGLASLLGLLIVIPFNAKLVEKIGIKKVFYGAVVIQIISRLVLSISLSNKSLILISVLFGSMGGILIPLLLVPLLANATDYGLYKFKVDSKGMIASVKGGLDKFANSVTPAFIGLILSIVGFTSGADVQPESAISWIKIIYIYGPIIVSIFVVLPIFFYKLDAKKMVKIHQELNGTES